jgi:Tol biopolymer transport system component
MDSSIVPHLLVNSNLNWDENPQFSPDGKYLVWDRSQPPDTHRDLLRGTLVYDSSNGHINITDVNSITNLTNTPTKDEYDPKWSPRISVQRIAYTYRSDTNSTDYEVWTMNPIDGSNNQVYYNPNRNGYPAWSPACDRIYFETDHGNSGLFFIAYLSYPNPSGNPNVLVQSNTLNLRYPTRLPNGSYIAYIRVGETSPGNGSIFVTSTSSGGNGNKLIPSSYGFDNADNLWPAW